ncbi:hypothetical protein GF342_02595 [Candidatus Woesearchaeota archaeon]|nr:hypothetical protein [Candidatus Woesearchaeota archaeon]
MKKRNLLSFGFLITIFLASMVYAQSPVDVIISIFAGIGRALSGIGNALFGSLDTQAGVIGLLQFIAWLLMAVVTYELLRFVNLSKGVRIIIGALVSLGLVLVIPGTLILTLFAQFGALVTLFVLVIFGAVLTLATSWLKPIDSWQKLLIVCLVWGSFLWIMWNLFLGINTSNAIPGELAQWPMVVFTIYGVGVLAWLILSVLFSGGQTVAEGKTFKAIKKAASKKWESAVLSKVGRETERVASSLDKHYNELKSKGATWDANALKDNFCQPVELELAKISSLLNVEVSKMDAVSGKPHQTLVDYIKNNVIKFIEATGNPTIGGFHLKHGGLEPWLKEGGWLHSNWETGDNVKSDLATYCTAELGPALATFHDMLYKVNKDLPNL